MMSKKILAAVAALGLCAIGCHDSTGERGNPRKLDPNQSGGRPVSTDVNTGAGGVGGTGTGVGGSTTR